MANEHPAVRFIRRNGKVIPISAPSGNGARQVGNAARLVKNAAGVAGAAVGAHAIHQSGIKPSHPGITVNKALDLTSLGLSVASGAVGAATFTGGAKSFIGGVVGSYALDALGAAANIASVSGKAPFKEKAKQVAKQEARNFAVGNAVYLGGLIGMKKNRAEMAGMASRGAAYASKILAFGRKALRVV